MLEVGGNQCIFVCFHLSIYMQFVCLVTLKALVYESKVSNSDFRFIEVTCGSKVKWTKCEVSDLC